MFKMMFLCLSAEMTALVFISKICLEKIRERKCIRRNFELICVCGHDKIDQNRNMRGNLCFKNGSFRRHESNPEKTINRILSYYPWHCPDFSLGNFYMSKLYVLNVDHNRLRNLRRKCDQSESFG